MRLPRIHFGKRYGITAFFPTFEAQRVATERTEGLVGYFIACTRNHSPVRWMKDLDTLARSCYLQGVEDAAVAMAMTDKKKQ